MGWLVKNINYFIWLCNGHIIQSIHFYNITSFLLGTMGHEKNGIFPPNIGSLYSIGNDFTLKKQISPVSISNGLAWNPNNDIFYYIDSLSYQIVAYNYNSQTGIICKKFIIYQYNIFYIKFTILILFFYSK